jgi:hypothetical protein
MIVLGMPAWSAERHYWIDPCTDEETGCKADDPQLAEWALKDWASSSGGQLTVVKAKDMNSAHIRIHWAQNAALYGEARPIMVNGVRGAEVYVLADLSGSDREIRQAVRLDGLLREAIVYLTCLHETGHALGLAHTDSFADIMYSFQFGGDIPEYFGRYRRQLKKRDDIQKTTGTSPADREALKKALVR